jgi:hypothetical protein
MTFGRPVTIPKTLAASVPLPSAIGADVGGHSHVPFNELSHATSGTVFFVKTLELFDIVNDILTAVYTSNGNMCNGDELGLSSGTRVAPNLATVFGLDDALMAWPRSLPPHLRISSDRSFESTISRRQAILCRTRYDLTLVMR